MDTKRGADSSNNPNLAANANDNDSDNDSTNDDSNDGYRQVTDV